MTKQSVRETKKNRTRNQLIAVATKLFVEKGFDATTVDDIVAIADVSQRTFFRYFPTKESVLFWDHENRVEQFEQLLSDNEQDLPPFRRIRTAMFFMAEQYQQKRENHLTEYQIVISSKYLIGVAVERDFSLQKKLADALKTWRGRPYISERQARIIAGAIFGAIREQMEEWFEDRCRKDLQDSGSEVFRLTDAIEAEFAPTDKV